MGDGYATVPLRECDGCETVTVCRTTDDGVFCSLCMVSKDACDVLGMNPSDDFKTIIVAAAEGTPPTFEQMYELLGSTVGGVLLWLIENPHHLRVLATEASERAAIGRTADSE
jgi:hypothetical protein